LGIVLGFCLKDALHMGFGTMLCDTGYYLPIMLMINIPLGFAGWALHILIKRWKSKGYLKTAAMVILTVLLSALGVFIPRAMDLMGSESGSWLASGSISLFGLGLLIATAVSVVLPWWLLWGQDHPEKL
jgi:hypothetical protein